MMKKICCFAGHSELYNQDKIYNELLKLIEKLIVEENVSEFFVGNYGAFDRISARAISTLKEKYPMLQLNLLIPYLTSDINKNNGYYTKIYDNILIADIPQKTPKKFGILKCNEYMIKSSDYLICYLNHSWGGAYKTLQFAKKKKHIKIFYL